MIFVALAVTVGMWFERFVIIVSSLHQDFLPSAWHIYKPTLVDYRNSPGILRSLLHAGASLREGAARDRHHGNEDRTAWSAASARGRLP